MEPADIGLHDNVIKLGRRSGRHPEKTAGFSRTESMKKSWTGL